MASAMLCDDATWSYVLWLYSVVWWYYAGVVACGYMEAMVVRGLWCCVSTVVGCDVV